MALNFEKYAQEANEIINELAENLSTNRESAARIMRAVLHAFRDRLPLQESVHLGQQLPMGLKGVYFDQFHPGTEPEKLRNEHDLFEYIKSKDFGGDIRDFPDDETTRKNVQTVFDTLREHITEGQLEHVKGALNKQLQGLVAHHE